MEDVLRSCCASLDIHQKVIVACVIRSVEGKKRPEKFFGSFVTQRLVAFWTYLIS
jgi:transposase